MTYKFLKEVLPYLILIITGFILLHSIFNAGFMMYSDHIPHFMESYYLKEMLKNGQISGWYPYMFAGMPIFTYIPMLGHYLIILLSLFTNLTFAYKLIFFLSFIGPSLLMYNFLKPSFNRIIAFAASFPLLLIPSWHGAMMTGLWATGVAISCLIIFIKFSLKFKEQNLRNSIILGFILALVILAHTIIGIAAILFLICQILVIKNYKNSIKNFFITIIFGILIIGFYTLPIATTNSWIETPISRIGLGNSLKEIAVTEVGMLFSLKPQLQPLLDIKNGNILQGGVDLIISILKNISVLVLGILAIAGIIISIKKYKNNDDVKIILLFFFFLLLMASNFWILIPIKIKMLDTLGVYPHRIVYIARMLLAFFAAIGLKEIKSYRNILLIPLFIIPLLTINWYIPEKHLTQTSSSSLVLPEMIEMFNWIDKNVPYNETRVFDQNPYLQIRVERKNLLPALSPIYTKTHLLSSWIARVNPTEEFLTSTNSIGKENLNNIDIGNFKSLLINYNAKYVITSETKLKTLLINSEDFELQKEGKFFSIFSFKEYNPKWISGNISYNIVKFTDQELEFKILNNITQEIEIKTTYHPYWQVYINDEKVDIYKTEKGLIGLNIPPDKINVNIKFVPIPKIFIIISIISIVIGLVLLIKKKN